MNHYALFHAVVQTNGKYFQFSWQPGTPWPEIHAAVDEFKKELAALEEHYNKQAEQATPQAPAEAPAS